MTALEKYWTDLAAHGRRLEACPLPGLIEADSARFDAFSRGGAGLLFDFSREKLDAAALDALVALAEAASLEARRDALFRGDHVNATEDRPALHVAQRAVPGTDRAEDAILTERARVTDFAAAVRAGEKRSSAGHRFTDVLCLGTGGSSLGPEMAAQALAPWHDGPRLHFVSNVDGADLRDTLSKLDPARTLVTIASKSFTTLETMTNARAVRAWQGAGADANTVALTALPDRAREAGIDPERIFTMPDGVGGRFSLWSSIGLPLAVALGGEAFEDLLAGAAKLDRHFAQAPLGENLPVLLALIGIWRRNVLGHEAVAVVPYSQRLSRFPAYLQQLEMESNGKRVGLDGQSVGRPTAPLIFGEPGTGAQHSFFQLLHQGTDVIPVDFILAAEPVPGDSPAQHDLLLASALAQASALAFGDAGTDPHRTCPGDRPSSVILLEQLDPAALGALIALYEHKVFCQGVLWGINSFDQFGVELGKRLTDRLLPLVTQADAAVDADPATQDLATAIRARRADRDA